jgi:hypothetical protein
MATLSFFKHKPEVGIGIFRHAGYDDNGDFLLQDLMQERKPFSVRKVDIQNQYDECPDFDVETYLKDRTTCGRRMNDWGPWQREENLDYWQDRGSDGIRCSFCGSAKFELFEEVIAAVNEGKDGYSIEQAKNYKFYLGTPENSHIKFYTPHIPREVWQDEERLKKLNADLSSAAKKSWDKFMARVKRPIE